MKRILLVSVLLYAIHAQAPGTPEPLSAWPYFKDCLLYTS